MNTVLEFLNTLFDQNLGYSAMNTARAALLTFIFINGKPVGSQPLVIRYLKGVFALRPSLPKYQVTWHVQQVLEYLRTLWPLSALSLQKLSHKLAMLCLLLTGQRGQTVHMFDIHNISRDKNSYRIELVIPLNKPGLVIISLKSICRRLVTRKFVSFIH